MWPPSAALRLYGSSRRGRAAGCPLNPVHAWLLFMEANGRKMFAEWPDSRSGGGSCQPGHSGSRPPLTRFLFCLSRAFQVLSAQHVACSRRDEGALMIWIGRSVYDPKVLIGGRWLIHLLLHLRATHFLPSMILSYQRRIQSPLNLLDND